MARRQTHGAVAAPRRPVAVDLFAGAGGLSLGFEQAGFDVLAAVDNDPVHLAVHERNFPHSFALCHDVGTVTAEALHAAIGKGWSLAQRDGEWDGVVDCLFGGPSCQGFSDMGRQNPDDDRNNLVFAFARVVRELKPRAFVIENVPGLLFPKFRGHLDRLQTELTNAGYRLVRELPVVLDASEHGVPQRRRRVFIVGVLDGVDLPRDPEASACSPTVAEALDDLPAIEGVEALLTSDRLQMTVAMVERMDASASDYVRSLRTRTGLEFERRWTASILTGSQRTVHQPSVVERFRDLAPGSADATSRTHRLHGDGYSPTLRAGTGRDHGSFTAPRPIHHRLPRVITVREAARLHSFPDWFSFNTAKWHALREIGNAVPPRLAAVVADTVVKALGAERILPTRVLEPGPDTLLEHSLVTASHHFGIDRACLTQDVRRARN